MTGDGNDRMKRAGELEALRAHFAKLRLEIAPQRDLWPDIRAAIGDEGGAVVEVEPPERAEAAVQAEQAAEESDQVPAAIPSRRVPPWWRRPVSLAAAAVLTLGAVLWLTMLDDRADVTADTRPAAERYARLEAPYVAAAADLMATLEHRRDELPPDVAEPFTKTLAVIDEALRETRAAVLRDPGNETLTGMALAAHQRKLDFLQQVAQWSTNE